MLIFAYSFTCHVSNSRLNYLCNNGDDGAGGGTGGGFSAPTFLEEFFQFKYEVRITGKEEEKTRIKEKKICFKFESSHMTLLSILTAEVHSD